MLAVVVPVEAPLIVYHNVGSNANYRFRPEGSRNDFGTAVENGCRLTAEGSRHNWTKHNHLDCKSAAGSGSGMQRSGSAHKCRNKQRGCIRSVLVYMEDSHSHMPEDYTGKTAYRAVDCKQLVDRHAAVDMIDPSGSSPSKKTSQAIEQHVSTLSAIAMTHFDQRKTDRKRHEPTAGLAGID